MSPSSTDREINKLFGGPLLSKLGKKSEGTPKSHNDLKITRTKIEPLPEMENVEIIHSQKREEESDEDETKPKQVRDESDKDLVHDLGGPFSPL